MRQDKINKVVAQPKLHFSRCMAGHRVLLPHIWPSISHLTYPGQYVHLQNLQVLHHVDLQALLEDVWQHDMTFRRNHSRHHHSGWKLGLHDFWNILRAHRQPTIVLVVYCLILTKIFLVREEPNHVALQRMFEFVEKFLTVLQSLLGLWLSVIFFFIL